MFKLTKLVSLNFSHSRLLRVGRQLLNEMISNAK